MLYIIISFIAVDHSWAHMYDRCPCDPLDQSGPPTSESHLMNGRDLALLFHIGTLIINNRCLIGTNIILELIQAETNLYTIVTTSFLAYLWVYLCGDESEKVEKTLKTVNSTCLFDLFLTSKQSIDLDGQR